MDPIELEFAGCGFVPRIDCWLFLQPDFFPFHRRPDALELKTVCLPVQSFFPEFQNVSSHLYKALEYSVHAIYPLNGCCVRLHAYWNQRLF